MKTYTDINQSEELAKFLPNESADLFYRSNKENVKLRWESSDPVVTYPCWSLAVLMEIIKKAGAYLSITYTVKEDDTWMAAACYKYTNKMIKDWHIYKNLIDACYEVIIVMHEHKLL